VDGWAVPPGCHMKILQNGWLL